MTELKLIPKFISNIYDGILEEARTVDDVFDLCFNCFARTDLHLLRHEMTSYLMSNPSDESLSRLWKRSNYSYAADNPKNIKLLLEMALKRLDFHLN